MCAKTGMAQKGKASSFKAYPASSVPAWSQASTQSHSNGTTTQSLRVRLQQTWKASLPWWLVSRVHLCPTKDSEGLWRKEGGRE